MRFVESRIGDIVVVDIVGRLDSDAFAALTEKLDSAIAARPEAILLDLAELEYVNSTGLRALMLAAKQIRKTQIRLVLCGLRENVSELFEVSGLNKVFDVQPERAGALAMLSD